MITVFKIKGKIDESKALKSTSRNFLKCEVSKIEDPQFLLLDLIELADQTSDTITDNNNYQIIISI